MGKIYAIAFIILISAGLLLYRLNLQDIRQEQNVQQNQNQAESGNASEEKNKSAKLQPPLDRSGERVTKKPFGIFVDPENSPVDPERFRGFHTAIDLEAFPEEEKSDVSINAVCTGELKVKRDAIGYGGVVVQACELDDQPVTVIYGHLRLSSIGAEVGQKVDMGERIGLLGDAYSDETDGERKHLHLGIHKGADINILGYVQNKAELSNWIDPCGYICKN